VTGGATAGDWELAGTLRLRALIGHLLFVERCVDLSHDDAAEYHQRSLPLGFRQQIPQLVETYGPAENWARGGAMTAISLGMGRLLGPVLVELESIPPTVVGRRARLSATPPIPVKGKQWG
jgi:hypothetical protein